MNNHTSFVIAKMIAYIGGVAYYLFFVWIILLIDILVKIFLGFDKYYFCRMFIKPYRNILSIKNIEERDVNYLPKFIEYIRAFFLTF